MKKEVVFMAGNGLVSFFFVLVPVGAILAIVFAGNFYKKISRFPEGTEKMKEIADAIRIGARAYLRRQYRGVAIFFFVMFVILLALGFAGGGSLKSLFVPLAFITGGICSGLAGFIGMTTGPWPTEPPCCPKVWMMVCGGFSERSGYGLIVVG